MATAPLSEAERQKPRRTFTFGPGSLGMTFTEAAGRCTFITEVAAGSQAAKKGVVAGSKLVSVAGHPMEGLGSDAVVARIKEEMQRAAQQPMTMELESSAYDAPFQSVETTPSGSNKKASLVARAFGFGSGTKSGSKR
jgi:C-terminal processing protease CtpA/Prc